MGDEHPLAILGRCRREDLHNAADEDDRLGPVPARAEVAHAALHGERDHFRSAALVEYTDSLLPNSKLVVMEGAGYLPAMIRPFDVAREIDEFFSGHAV